MNISAEQQATTETTSTEPTPQQPMPQPGSTSADGKSAMGGLEETIARLQETWKINHTRKLEEEAAKPKPSNLTILPPVFLPSTELAKKPPSLLEDKQSLLQFSQMLKQCYLTMELYGKDTSQFETVLEFFLNFLGHIPAKQIFLAMEKYIDNRTRFPAPADIIGIIEGRIKRDPAYYKTLIAKRGSISFEESHYIKQYEIQTRDDWE